MVTENARTGHSLLTGAGSSILRMHEEAERWTAKARCRTLDPEIFFPHDGLGVQRAAAYCAECPVAEACLEYAMRNNIPHGVFGGLSERARARLRRTRSAARTRSNSN